jgi:hypothetical protein
LTCFFFTKGAEDPFEERAFGISDGFREKRSAAAFAVVRLEELELLSRVSGLCVTLNRAFFVNNAKRRSWSKEKELSFGTFMKNSLIEMIKRINAHYRVKHCQFPSFQVLILFLVET